MSQPKGGLLRLREQFFQELLPANGGGYATAFKATMLSLTLALDYDQNVI
jgi:hypothetical protein